MAIDFDTKIIQHKPFENAAGQYNYGRVENEDKHILGIPEDFNFGGAEIELYTTVEHLPSTWELNPDGKIWLYKGSMMTLDKIWIYGRGKESDKYRYYDHMMATYFVDGDRTGVISDSADGDELQSIVGVSDSTWSSPHMMAFKDKGTFEFGSSCAEATGFLGLARTGDFCNYNICSSGYYSSLERIIYDFPFEGHSKTNDDWSINQVFNVDEDAWTSALTGKIDESYYYLITRVSADESEYSAIGHGWLELTGGYKSDGLNRGYSVYAMHKSLLGDVFIKNMTKTFCWVDEDDDNDYVGTNGAGQASEGNIKWSEPGCDVIIKTQSPTHYWNPDQTRLQYNGSNWNLSNNKKFWSTSDNHNFEGHGWPSTNHSGRAYGSYGAKVTFTPPEWSPEKAAAAGYKWIKEKDGIVIFGQLNPKFDTDFTGFPDVFYATQGKFWDSSLIKDFRPISRVTSVIDTFGEPTDLQNYYPKGTEYSFNASAPLTVRLKFDYFQNIDNFNPKPFEEGDNPAENNYDIKYGWFVVNWDWDSSWEGGETLSEIAEFDFPTTEAEVINRQMNLNTYKLKTQGNSDVDTNEVGWGFDVNNDEAMHTYNTPGTKVIKVVFLTYIYSHHGGQDIEGDNYAGNYIQALQWKMATVKINLTTDSSFVNDFADVGGADYTYLPYPDVLQYDYPEGDIEIDDDTGKQIWCEDGINAPVNVLPSENKLCEFRKSSHPVISGLSSDSTYVQTLKGLLATDKWDTSEGNDKILAEKSFMNTPNQALDEYGNFLGQVDLSTTRYLNKPFNMFEFLDIDMVYNFIPPVKNNYCSKIRGYNYEDEEAFTNDLKNYQEETADNYPDCGQRFGTTFNPEGDLQIGIPTNPNTGEGVNTGAALTWFAVCNDGTEVLLKDAFGNGWPPVANQGPYRLIDGSMSESGNVNTEPGANGEWACAQVMGQPYSDILDTWDIEATPDETNVVSVDDSTGDIFYPYSNTEYWSPDSRSFPIESAATSIFISEYPNFHDKCLAEINFDSFDGVTIRDSSGNGCKGIVFGDFSIKKEKKGQPTQRDSSIDTPKIAKDDKKAF